jgi:hypothetical protein
MALHWKYWHEKLSGEIPVLDLPTDFPRPSMPTFNGDAVSMSLSPEQTEKLNLFSKTQKNEPVRNAFSYVEGVILLLYGTRRHHCWQSGCW